MRDEEDVERVLMAYSPRINEVLDRSREQIAKDESLSHDEFWANLGSNEGGSPGRRRSIRGKEGIIMSVATDTARASGETRIAIKGVSWKIYESWIDSLPERTPI